MTDTQTAWNRLLSLIDATKASDLGTSPTTAIADAIRESVVNAPSLRHCLYPSCLREFDMMARMNGREPARPSWSGDGWKQINRGPSSGTVCPDHADIVTAHLARIIDLPNGRWAVHCACGWELTPQAWGGLLRPLWEQHLLTAAGELPAPEAPTERFERLPLAEHTETTLTELYELLEDTEHDRQETREAAQAMFKGWDWHRRAWGDISRAISAVCNMMRVDPRDWAANRYDAYLWGVLIGWGCKEQHDHDDECGGDTALLEVAEKHQWNEHRVKYVREMRALLAPITDPQPKEPTT